MTTKYANENGGLGREPSVPSSKSKKQLLLELLALENDPLGDVGQTEDLPRASNSNEPENIDSIDDNEIITKPKKKLTEKQIEALKKGQQKRDENRERLKAEKMKKDEIEKQLLEEKLVKKAIAVKKKQIKKQIILDEISDDDTELPIEKIKKSPVPDLAQGSRADAQGRRSDGPPLGPPLAQPLAPPSAQPSNKPVIKFF